MRQVLPQLVTVPLLFACTAVLGIDDEYRSAARSSPDAAARGSGGAPAVAGSAGVGVVTGATGGEPSGGAPDAGSDCPEGQKTCDIEGQGALCVVPDPSVGCSLDTCDACPAAPQGGYSVCAGGQCDFACHEGYQRSGSTCAPTGSGGAGGTGTGDACVVDTDCPSCGAFAGCCAPVGQTCGCLYVAWCQ